MTSHSSFLLAAVCLVVTLQASTAWYGDQSEWNKPDACNHYICPPFKIIDRTADYEHREYLPGVWVMTTDQPRTEWYRDLMDYMNGENEGGVKLHRTVPVVKKYQFTPDNWMMGESLSMAFYTNMTHPPTPNNRKLHIVRFPTTRMYMRSYGGWTNSVMAQWNAKQLIHAIDSNEILDRDHVWVGVYNAPWTIFGRYNEVAFTSQAQNDGQ